MRISIFLTVSDPESRMDPAQEAVESYLTIADEVVILNGSKKAFKYHHPKVKHYYYEWPDQFDWPFIGEQFQRAYDLCTGDWVIRMDCDYILHHQTAGRLRDELKNAQRQPVAAMHKWQFIIVDRYNLKSRVPNCYQKGLYNDRIKLNGGGDLCQPTLDGKEINKNQIYDTRVEFFNYDFSFKTLPVIVKDFPRFSRAWKNHFKDDRFGDGTAKGAMDFWFRMMEGKGKKSSKQIALSEHPKFIQNRIANMTSDLCGYSLFGRLKKASYFEE